MNVLIDLNIVLDVLLVRETWLADSKAIWDANHEKRIRGYLAATELTNLFYIARRIVGQEKARAGVRTCLDSFEVVAVSHALLKNADAMAGNDFEDNVCIGCALSAGLDGLVTRNPDDFANSSLAVYTPAQLLVHLAKTQPAPP